MPTPSRILISGGSGFIGEHLRKLLSDQKIDYSVLSRNQQKLECPVFQWNPDKLEMDPKALDGVDTIVNLAGVGIADGRWSAERKWEILQSRSKSTDTLYNALKSGNTKVKTVVSASATGYYGNSGLELMEEDNPPGKDFLGMTCLAWEQSVRRIEQLGIRVVILRIGFVLAQNGGALPVMKIPVKFFVGSALGSGRQFISWVHIEDVCRAILHVSSDSNVRGAYNLTAPAPVSNKEFIKTLAKTMHRPFWPISVPSFLLRILLGEKSEIVLHGQRVSSEKLQQTGFQFMHVDLLKCMQLILDKGSN